MTAFVDTSALYAYLVADDAGHGAVAAALQEAVRTEAGFRMLPGG